MGKAWYVDYDKVGELHIRLSGSPNWDLMKTTEWCTGCIHGSVHTEPRSDNNLCESCARKFGYIW